MSTEYQPFHPEFSKESELDQQYNYALQNIIFYTVHAPGDHTLTYYKESEPKLEFDAPEVFRFLVSEYEHLDFHERYWALMEWVRNQNEIDASCGLDFTVQTYKDLFADINDAEEEADQLIETKRLNDE